MVKVKAVRTVECVVAGFRRYAGEPIEVASLLLGLYDGPRLRHVGVSSSFPGARRRELARLLLSLAAPLSGHPWERGFNLASNPAGRLGGSAGRWDPRSMSLDWIPLRPELVCEVACDRVDGFLFRHPARFVRWRPDREPRSCTLDQLGAPAERAGDAPGTAAP